MRNEDSDVRLSDLANPAVVAAELARLEEQERLAAGIHEYPEFLKLSTVEERTPKQQTRFEELSAIYNPPASAEKIDEAQRRWTREMLERAVKFRRVGFGLNRELSEVNLT